MRVPFWRPKRNRAQLALAIYGSFMLVLLFGRGVHWQGEYWSQVQNNLNLIPFRTVLLYLRLLRQTQSAYFIQHAVMNLLGNIVMFVPLGFLLPNVWPGLRSPLRFFFAIVLLISLVELLQLFTLLGRCDVDDLLLNVAGAGSGFFASRLYAGKKNKQ